MTEGTAAAEGRRRAAVIVAARRHIGTPWQHLGRSPQGLDCVGLVVVVCRELAISGYDVAAYPREPRSSEFLAHFIRGGGTRVTMETALPGDLILFREARFPCHVAILSEKDGIATIIHAHLPRGAVLEEAFIPVWRRKFVAAIRLPGTRAA